VVTGLAGPCHSAALEPASILVVNLPIFAPEHFAVVALDGDTVSGKVPEDDRRSYQLLDLQESHWQLAAGLILTVMSTYSGPPLEEREVVLESACRQC